MKRNKLAGLIIAMLLGSFIIFGFAKNPYEVPAGVCSCYGAPPGDIGPGCVMVGLLIPCDDGWGILHFCDDENPYQGSLCSCESETFPCDDPPPEE